MAVLFESGMSLYHVAIPVATAVGALDIAIRYPTEGERFLCTYKWQYCLAQIA
jgi:hypothetical protein